MSHGVIRTDLMDGTDVRADLVSIKYMGADGNTPTAIDNGNVLKVGGLIAGEREIYSGSAVSATDSIKDIVVVASPEVMYDERMKNFSDFYNEADKPARGYRLNAGQIFSLTADCFTAEDDPEVGFYVELAAGTKLNIVEEPTEAPEGGTAPTVLGKVLDIETNGGYTYYAIVVGQE